MSNVLQTARHNGYKIEIEYEIDPSRPRTDWGEPYSVFVAWHPRYTLGDVNVSRDREAIEAEIVAPRVALNVWAYEHGAITISTAPFGDPWDSGQVGVIYATAEAIRKEYSVKRITKALEERVRDCLKAEIEELDDFLNGRVYAYTIRDPRGRVVASCGDFYGTPEELLAEARAEAGSLPKLDRVKVAHVRPWASPNASGPQRDARPTNVKKSA